MFDDEEARQFSFSFLFILSFNEKYDLDDFNLNMVQYMNYKWKKKYLIFFSIYIYVFKSNLAIANRVNEFFFIKILKINKIDE